MYILLVGLFDLPSEKSEKRTLGKKNPFCIFKYNYIYNYKFLSILVGFFCFNNSNTQVKFVYYKYILLQMISIFWLISWKYIEWKIAY